MTVMAATETTLRERADAAWAARAEHELAAAAHSLRAQMLAKLRVRDVDVEDMFTQNVRPDNRVGCEHDGMTFKLGQSRELSVVVWRCEHKGCDEYQTAPVTDLVSLGRGLALGASHQATQPKCQAHS